MDDGTIAPAITRTVLRNRREHEPFAFKHEGITYVAGIHRAPNGNVLEIFLDSGKVGSTAQILSRDSAVLLSIALQCGVPMEWLRKAITRDADGKPLGPVGALLDLIHERDKE